MNLVNVSDNEKELPYNYLAERLILGSILINPDAIMIVSQQLSVESFYLKSHQIIYKGLLDLYRQGSVLDYITLTTWLQDNNLLEYLEDVSMIADFLNQVITVGYLEDYIALVYEKYLRRLIIDLGYDLIDYGYSTKLSLDKIFNTVEERFLFLNKKKEKKLFSNSAEVLKQILKEIKDRLKTSTMPGFPSGFYELDAITQGFHKSDLIILASRPSMGKTAFSLFLAKNICQQCNVGIAFFSLEMTKQQLFYRLLAMETLISHTKLKSSRVTKEEWININESIALLSELPLYVDDTPNISISEIYFKIKKLKQEFTGNLGLIVIDYLQLIEEPDSNENRVQELSKITRNLKKLARDFNLPILVLSQLSRNVETRPNKRPMLCDLRDSGSIEQDADLVLMLYRDDYYNQLTNDKNIIEINIAKHRNGSIGNAKLIFDPQYLTFKSMRIENL
jgi:replicative DNA helicase